MLQFNSLPSHRDKICTNNINIYLIVLVFTYATSETQSFENNVSTNVNTVGSQHNTTKSNYHTFNILYPGLEDFDL